MIAALVALVAFGASAQKFRVGVKGGLNFPSKDAFSVSDDSDASGWHAGAFGLIKISKFGIQPEILYSSFNFDDSNADAETNFNFITVPIIAKYYILQGINIQAGPQFGILLDSESKTPVATVDNTDILNSSDLSIAVGAGVDLPFGLSVDARYLIGISDLGDDPSLTDDINVSTFQVSIGYALVKLGL